MNTSKESFNKQRTSERKARQFQLRETEIVTAAIELFRKHDLASVTIEQIAIRTDIGKGTIYKHFKSKDEIYARILIDLNSMLRSEIATVDTNMSFHPRLDKIIETIWRHDMQDSQLLRRLNQHLTSGDFRQNLGEKMTLAFDAMQQEDSQFYLTLLADAQERNEIINEPLDTLLFTAISAVDGAILHFWQLESIGAVTQKDSPRYLKSLQGFVYRALTCGQSTQAPTYQ